MNQFYPESEEAAILPWRLAKHLYNHLVGTPRWRAIPAFTVFENWLSGLDGRRRP